MLATRITIPAGLDVAGPCCRPRSGAATRRWAPRRRSRTPQAAEDGGASASTSTSSGGTSGGGGGGGPVYQGVYGPWRVEREDELEVLL